MHWPFRFRDNAEIRQSTKHLKKYDRNNYKLEIKRCVPDDKGEYIVRASNSYGEKEYAVFLTVERKSNEIGKKKRVPLGVNVSQMWSYTYVAFLSYLSFVTLHRYLDGRVKKEKSIF
jgi:hypothetical protein